MSWEAAQEVSLEALMLIVCSHDHIHIHAEEVLLFVCNDCISVHSHTIHDDHSHDDHSHDDHSHDGQVPQKPLQRG